MKVSTIIGLLLSMVWIVSFIFMIFEDAYEVSRYELQSQLLILAVPYAMLWFVVGLVRHRYELDVFDQQDDIED